MAELEVSINNFTDAPEKDFRALLGHLEEKMGMRIHCSVVDWGDAWTEMMKIVLYKHGPVLSQVGSTWMGSLESTEGVRPFSSAEISRIGSASNFHKGAWQTVISESGSQIIGVPWFLDTYMLYYRKDLLEQAGVDESTAFASLESLDETVKKLHAAGNPIPFALPTRRSSRANMHHIANWVWSHGGDFISEDGQTLLLSDAKTRQGMKAYFSLHKYLPPSAQNLHDFECYSSFLQGQAAITLRNSGMLYAVRDNAEFAPYRDKFGMAAMPGINFVGGSNLVLWKHIPPQMEKYAITLIEYLTSPEVQFAHLAQAAALPAHVDALEKVRKETEFAPIIDTILKGRSFRKLRLWGLVEDKLRVAIGNIWDALFSKEYPNIDNEIANELDPLEYRLQLTLSNI
jgi:multiple sugar transport system substrate-binding protein